MNAAPSLTDYYARRATEYERVYEKPERQTDLAHLRERIPALLADRDVHEFACGTGYWTQFIVREAASVWATDYNEEVLEVARAKQLPSDRVKFALGDAFSVSRSSIRRNGGFAGFWWSHLRVEDQVDGFMRAVVSALAPGARFVLVDNAYVDGSSTPLSRTDSAGNTYQRRKLADGSEHEVLKNFPDESAVRRALAPYATAVHWERLPHYWLAWADLR